MTAEELRTSFLAFAGQPTARRFALQLRADKEAETRPPFRPRRTDLRYWQEQLWLQFSRSCDGVPPELSELRNALLWCDVHNRSLEAGHAVADGYGVTDRDGKLLDKAFGRIRDERFPFGFGFWTIVCPDCVRSCREWMDNAKTNRAQ